MTFPMPFKRNDFDEVKKVKRNNYSSDLERRKWRKKITARHATNPFPLRVRIETTRSEWFLQTNTSIHILNGNGIIRCVISTFIPFQM